MSDRRRSRARIRYALDDANRLVIRDRPPFGTRLRPARIVDGIVATDQHNQLSYHASSRLDGGTGPQTLNLDGTWKLTPQHELAFTLHGSADAPRQTLYLKGGIAEAKAHTLVFALRRSADDDPSTRPSANSGLAQGRPERSATGLGGESKDDLREAQRLTLSGRWRTDARNRLNFLVERADGSEDRLTLQGGWELGPRHELLYRYQSREGARRDRDAHALIFEGSWDITRSDRLVYRLAGSSDSAFEFKASLQSPSLNARDGRIAYQVGIGLSGGRVQQQRVTLFGAWKLNRDLSVSFEIPYADGRVQAIRFLGEARLDARDRIAVALHTSERKPLGLTVTFTRELVPDVNLFLQLRKDAEETSALGGVQVRF